jgi:hypothetical protein
MEKKWKQTVGFGCPICGTNCEVLSIHTFEDVEIEDEQLEPGDLVRCTALCGFESIVNNSENVYERIGNGNEKELQLAYKKTSHGIADELLRRAIGDGDLFYVQRDLSRRRLEAKRIAILMIDYAEECLIKYGSDSMELQNMDSNFRDFDKLRNEIKSF